MYFACSIVDLTYQEPISVSSSSFPAQTPVLLYFSADRHGQLGRKGQNCGIVSKKTNMKSSLPLYPVIVNS